MIMIDMNLAASQLITAQVTPTALPGEHSFELPRQEPVPQPELVTEDPARAVGPAEPRRPPACPSCTGTARQPAGPDTQDPDACAACTPGYGQHEPQD